MEYKEVEIASLVLKREEGSEEKQSGENRSSEYKFDTIDDYLHLGWRLHGAPYIKDTKLVQKLTKRENQYYTNILNIKNKTVRNVDEAKTLFQQMMSLMIKTFINSEKTKSNTGAKTDRRGEHIFAETTHEFKKVIAVAPKIEQQQHGLFEYWIQYMSLTFKVFSKLRELNHEHSDAVLQNIDNISAINGINTDIPDKVKLAVEDLFKSVFKCLPGDYYEYEFALRHILYPGRT